MNELKIVEAKEGISTQGQPSPYSSSDVPQKEKPKEVLEEVAKELNRKLLIIMNWLADREIKARDGATWQQVFVELTTISLFLEKLQTGELKK